MPTKAQIEAATAKTRDCPRCSTRMIGRALIDSDDRIYARWFMCLCGFDTRKPADLADFQKAEQPTAAPRLTANKL